MNKLSLFVCLAFVSCQSLSDQSFNPQKEIQGDWLILYPQHVLTNDAQRKIYGDAQDSIVNLLGLKMVSFNSDGEFIQIDSLFAKHGAWKITDTNRLSINAAGRGLERFKGVVVGIINDTILIEELVNIKNENIKLIWHLKKIASDKEGADLFNEATNRWRQKPVKKETDREINDRVIAMLKYYSLYFRIVSKESIYFSPVRVFLPFTYYQHGVGLIGFNNDFTKCFFDRDDAEKGYKTIKEAFERTKEVNYPSGNNYVIEYSEYFQMMAAVIN